MRAYHVFAALAASSAIALPAAAVSPGVDVGASRFTIGIQGFVPVICRANLDAAIVTPTTGTTQLGALKEFCNAPNGYRVVADYSPSLAGAKLYVDGNVVQLGSDGATEVSRSDVAAIGSHSLALELPQGVQDGAISFRIETN